MLLKNFGTAAGLQTWVIDESIPQANIVQIVFDGSRWWLFYF